MKFLNHNITFVVCSISLFTAFTTCVTPRTALRRDFDDSCGDIIDHVFLNDTFNGAGLIARALSYWTPPDSYQEVMSMCLGSRSGTGTLYQIRGVRRTIYRLNGVFSHDKEWSPPKTTSFTVICDESRLEAYPAFRQFSNRLCAQDPSIPGYTMEATQRDQSRDAFEHYAMILCRPYFTTPGLFITNGRPCEIRDQDKGDIGPWINTREYVVLKLMLQYAYVCQPACYTYRQTLSPHQVARIAIEKNTDGQGGGGGAKRYRRSHVGYFKLMIYS